MFPHVLQHLPDFKGIETCINPFVVQTCPLQHLPDFKGIETLGVLTSDSILACSTSLTSKGLRQKQTSLPLLCRFLQHLPDFKGISNCHGMTVVEYIKKRPVNVTGRFFVGLKFDLIGWVSR